MFDKIKELFKDTAIYGISTIVGRFLVFILVPFYTHYLTEADFGIYSNIYAYIAFLNIVYIYGMDAAFLKYSSMAENKDKKNVYSTAYWFVLLSTGILSVLIMVFKSSFVFLMQVPHQYEHLIYYVVLILFFDTLALIPFADLRLKRKAGKFAFIKMAFIFINISLILFFIIKLKYGIEAIFLSNLIASIAAFIFLIPEIGRSLNFKVKVESLKQMLNFGMPYLPAAISSTIVQVIDRPILTAMTNDATVGVYTANYKLGIFMMLFVSMFQYAWQPFFLVNAKEKDAKEIFSKILTLFVIIASVIWILVTLFVDDFAKFKLPGGNPIIAPAYWKGLVIVPTVLFAYIFHGMYVNFNAGIYIEEKTKYLPYITLVGAVINVVANLVLIPIYSLVGAAYATLFSYMAMAIGIYFVSQKFYKIEYEMGKVLRVIGLIVISSIVYFYLYYSNNLLLVNKFALLVFFIIMLFVLKVVKTAEFSILLRLLKVKKK
ncbi:MAG: oligosaccharide flippase family protein [bacterium]